MLSMPERGRLFFFETVTLSNFALVRRLDILADRYGRRVHITREVLDELLEGMVAGHAALSEVETALVSRVFTAAAPLSDDERGVYRQILQALSPGEASCVACAGARRGVVVTDDRAAREICTARSLPFTGTLGILIACCKDRSLLPQDADAALQGMIDSGFYSPVRRISELL
jgi:predicted nucleic acid-binding protein